ncbi:MAG: hypothetical protein B6D46_15000 [Polyangiaceae bacterium UTPRO1]|jgi:hypothetical protein|nr:hypothetical protein [Myxococcales bacterium]OQY64763.1 MAG: hypothetical protein B6D46_15000 [Polyangiaceae bacterium UTPRO1]
MANPLALLRRVDYTRIRRILVMQTGSIDAALGVAAKLHADFPGARIDGVVRDDDVVRIGPEVFAHVTPVRWEDRLGILRALRAERYDVIAVVLSRSGSRAFRLLPYLLRTRNFFLFNENFDYFPLKWSRLPSLAQHVSGQASVGALVRWAVERVVVTPLAALFLLLTTARIELRALRRRRRRRAAHARSG